MTDSAQTIDFELRELLMIPQPRFVCNQFSTVVLFDLNLVKAYYCQKSLRCFRYPIYNFLPYVFVDVYSFVPILPFESFQRHIKQLVGRLKRRVGGDHDENQ